MTTVTKEKYCSGCNESFSLDKFHKKGKDGYHSKCKKCINKQYREWHNRPKNKERRNKSTRDRYSPLQKKNFVLKANYGITLDIFNEMLKKQNGLCGICGADNPSGKGWCVDHNHSTNQVRELLCTNCNFLLGHCKENAKILQDAIRYLDKWKE